MRKYNFDLMPNVRYNRSKFSLGHGLKTTMSMGKLYPLDIQEVLPGDSFKCDLTAVARITSSFLKPVVDNAFMDVYHFFIPLRLLYDNNERVFGNPNPSAYVANNLDSFPVFPSVQTVSGGTVADYLGLPLGSIPGGCSVLPFRAFGKVYNEWFRNENTVSEMYVQTGNYASSEALNNNAWAPNNYTGQLPYVSKKRDYFTSCLPAPQKGASVLLPLGASAPVYGYPGTGNAYLNTFTAGDTSVRTMQNGSGGFSNSYTTPGNHAVSFPTKAQLDAASINPSLYADLSLATAANVNDFRLAVQLQKMLEKDARYGSSYREYLYGHFGVSSPDARLQYTEYLGGGRIPINVQQVAQTSEGTTTSPLGNLAGYSLTNGKSRFSKGFTEHGYILTVACIRQLHTYQNGIPKFFMRKDREDFYDPLFANLGEQPVYSQELFADSNYSLKQFVFGYNEAWAEYRYSPSKITGQMRSGISNTLDIWHFGDNYSGTPSLTSSFTNETSQFFDRTLSVPSTSQDNFLVDFWFDMSAIRVMPTYSVPGLVDHH